MQHHVKPFNSALGVTHIKDKKDASFIFGL